LNTHSVESLSDASAIMAAAGEHPFARVFVTGLAGPHGYRSDGGVAWRGVGPFGPVLIGLGAAGPVGALVPRLRGDDLRAAHLPPGVPAPFAARVDEWEFRWAPSAPAPHPDESSVAQLGEADHVDIAALLDAALPDSMVRPGHPRVRRWYGIRVAGRLVACGADASRGAGFLSGLAVDPRHQRNGLGTALTAAMTRLLHEEYGVVALGVYPSNLGARRLYTRLGFTEVLTVSSSARP
jgi:ribosomal protein S18 acetylase RimI-like enzyme